MPRKVDYPRASLSRALDLASAVHSLGGRASLDMTAQKIRMSLGGAFYSLVSAATKYGLLESEGKGQSGRRLKTTEIYQRYRLAYGDEEQTEALQHAALMPPAFEELYSRFVGSRVPEEFLGKLLEREYAVTGSEASRVGGYLIEALQMAGLMNENYEVLARSGADRMDDNAFDQPTTSAPTAESAATKTDDRSYERSSEAASAPKDHYVISVQGPDLSTSVHVHEMDDFDLVEAVMNRVRRKISKSAQSGGSAESKEPNDEGGGIFE